MTLRPCLVCGEPSPGPRCAEHTIGDTRTDRTHVAWRNYARWKNLSKRLRRLSPFCEFCGATEQLAVDHIIPVSQCPELTYAEENCRVLCKPCNGRRGNTFTPAEVHAVLSRLQATYRRRPTRAARERIAAAENALTWGDAPDGPPVRPGGKAQGAIHTAVETC